MSLSTVLPRLLAFDAEPCPRNDFQPFRFNIAATISALSKLSALDALQSLS